MSTPTEHISFSSFQVNFLLTSHEVGARRAIAGSKKIALCQVSTIALEREWKPPSHAGGDWHHYSSYEGGIFVSFIVY